MMSSVPDSSMQSSPTTCEYSQQHAPNIHCSIMDLTWYIPPSHSLTWCRFHTNNNKHAYQLHISNGDLRTVHPTSTAANPSCVEHVKRPKLSFTEGPDISYLVLMRQQPTLCILVAWWDLRRTDKSRVPKLYHSLHVNKLRSSLSQ